MVTETQLHRFGTTHQALMLLPSDWTQLPLDGKATRLDRLVSGLELEGEGAKSLVRQSLGSLLEQARAINAVFAAVLFGASDVPVTGSLAICELPNEFTSATVVEVTWRAGGREIERYSSPEGPLVTTERTRPVEVASATDTIDVWEMQAALPHPTSGGLLFSFSTPMLSVSEQFKTLAMAVLGTVRWAEERGKS